MNTAPTQLLTACSIGVCFEAEGSGYGREIGKVKVDKYYVDLVPKMKLNGHILPECFLGHIY